MSERNDGDCGSDDPAFVEIMRSATKAAMETGSSAMEGVAIAMHATTTAMAIVREMAEVCSHSAVGRLRELGWADKDVEDRKDLLAACVTSETDAAVAAIASQFAGLVQYSESLVRARDAMTGAFAVVGGRAADKFDAGLRESAGMESRKPCEEFRLPEGFASQHLGAAMALALVIGCQNASHTSRHPAS